MRRGLSPSWDRSLPHLRVYLPLLINFLRPYTCIKHCLLGEFCPSRRQEPRKSSQPGNTCSKSHTLISMAPSQPGGSGIVTGYFSAMAWPLCWHHTHTETRRPTASTCAPLTHITQTKMHSVTHSTDSDKGISRNLQIHTCTRLTIHIFTGAQVPRHKYTATFQNTCAHTPRCIHTTGCKTRPGPAGLKETHLGWLLD